MGLPIVCLLFRGPRATPALLEFLEDTKVGRMPCQTPQEGGSEDDEESLGDLELWPEDVEAEAPEQ